jgi:hypothetical protein
VVKLSGSCEAATERQTWSGSIPVAGGASALIATSPGPWLWPKLESWAFSTLRASPQREDAQVFHRRDDRAVSSTTSEQQSAPLPVGAPAPDFTLASSPYDGSYALEDLVAELERAATA